MNFSILLISCLIFLLTKYVQSFEILDDVVSAVFYRRSKINDTRDLRIPKTIDAESAFLETADQIELWGYEAEKHKITTEDGYEINFFRIPGGPKSPKKEGKPVVYIQNGMSATSDCWVLFGPENDLAFLLADDGYDVWIGNHRGSYYGRNNTNLTVNDKEFWNFSYHEIATRDVPPIIDHILENTGQPKLTFIGHSLGATVSYVLLSEKPEYNDKMNLVVSFAPIAFWKKKPNMVYRIVITLSPIFLYALKFFGIYSILPRPTKINPLRTLCSNDSIFRNLCVLGIFVSLGKDSENFDFRILSYALLYDPAGISLQTIVHYKQNIITENYDCREDFREIVHNYVWLGDFAHYDHDDPVQQYFDLGINNKDVYGTDRPPIYDLAKISAPVALYYASNDALSFIENTEVLAAHLPNVVTFEAVSTVPFNHLDFVWATNAKEALYDKVIEFISKYSK